MFSPWSLSPRYLGRKSQQWKLQQRKLYFMANWKHSIREGLEMGCNLQKHPQRPTRARLQKVPQPPHIAPWTGEEIFTWEGVFPTQTVTVPPLLIPPSSFATCKLLVPRFLYFSLLYTEQSWILSLLRWKSLVPSILRPTWESSPMYEFCRLFQKLC